MLPALARLQGITSAAPPTETALAGAALRENDHRADHLRATLASDEAGRLVATPFERQDSGMLTVLSRADCLILRAPEAPAVKQGEIVHIIRLDQAGI